MGRKGDAGFGAGKINLQVGSGLEVSRRRFPHSRHLHAKQQHIVTLHITPAKLIQFITIELAKVITRYRRFEVVNLRRGARHPAQQDKGGTCCQLFPLLTVSVVIHVENPCRRSAQNTSACLKPKSSSCCGGTGEKTSVNRRAVSGCAGSSSTVEGSKPSPTTAKMMLFQESANSSRGITLLPSAGSPI